MTNTYVVWNLNVPICFPINQGRPSEANMSNYITTSRPSRLRTFRYENLYKCKKELLSCTQELETSRNVVGFKSRRNALGTIKDLVSSQQKVGQKFLYFKNFLIQHCLQKCTQTINPLNAELNPICYLLALLGAHHFLHVSRIRVKSLTLRLLMPYIYIWSTHSWCF